MDRLESVAPSERQAQLVEATCWECGKRFQCFEYVVCCTGTTFHVCEACEERLRGRDDAACPTDAAP
jgi:hypothetical protein